MAKKAKNKKGTTKSPTKARSPEPFRGGPLNVKSIAVGLINPAPWNPRKDLKPSDPEYQNLKRSLAEFSCVEPLVWNERSGNLVGGHQRLKVMVKEFGAKTIQVSVVNLDDDAEKRLNLALNKVGGDWDQGRLAELLTDLRSAEADLSATGFDDAEIERLIAAGDAAGQGQGSEPQLGAFEYRIIVTCESEEQQHELLERFDKEGLKCQPLIS